MQLKKSNSQKIILICKGIAMGIANKIPGISGGIVALAAGFYEELIFSFSKFNKTALSLLLKTEFKAFYNYVNGSFLTLLFTGVILSFFSASLILDRLIQHYPKQVWGFFFGMILASVIHIWVKEKKFSYKEYILIILGASFGILLSLVTPGQENDNLSFVFLCGMLSISGMILPGLSGSFLILVLGNYTLLLIDSVNALYYSLGDIVSFDFSFTDDPARMNLLGVLLVFTLGSVTGLPRFIKSSPLAFKILSKKNNSPINWFYSRFIEYNLALEISSEQNGYRIRSHQARINLAESKRNTKHLRNAFHTFRVWNCYTIRNI